MSRLLPALALTFCVVFTHFTLAQENNQPPDGFTALFDGKDLSGWHGMGHFDPRKLGALSEEARAAKRAADLADMQQHWTIENGELVNDGHGVYLTTDQDFGDFDLWIDYKTVAKADSGIYLRANPQVQIWDFTEAGGKWKIGADKGSGGLWNNSPGAPGKDPLALADKPFGQWNRLRVRQLGARTSVWLNGQLVVDHALMENFWDRGAPHFRTGPIQLQTHGGEIRWRNVFVREIPSDEANRILAAEGASGFASIFNGKDFQGWAGPTENYEVNDGVLMCQPHKGGTIYTTKEYGDFVARLEFKLPPGGNNGLAIRHPGSGDAAYGAMCELQVLDSEHPKYAQLDDRQYHGSAYGMVPAHRGYLRPTGEWNFQEVTVQGSTIKVELNGTVILDTDLAKVSETMAGRPHPGKDRTSGHFGFAGHSDPVQFRNVSIKQLDQTSSAGGASAQAKKAAPHAEEFTGRWNISILKVQDTFKTAWLKLDEKDGILTGALVWKWGSVVPISDVTLGKKGIRFRRGKESYRAALVDGQLRGVATMENGDKFRFVGSPADEMCDVTGTWKIHPESDPDASPGTFTLRQQEGEITGKAHDPEGYAYAVRSAKLDGYTLSFNAVPIDFDAPAREVRCEIRGDVAVGHVTIPLDNSETRTIAIAGQRQREWGQPVQLLQDASLDGWGPRDASKKFGWKVEDGVLENQPPDVDIMSEAKFRDFRLHLEYKVNPGSNSGVYLRGRYELQIYGSTKVEDHGNMAVYSRLTPNKNPLKPGEWNDLDVTFIGRWLTVVLNGETVHDNQYLEGSTGGAWDAQEEEPGPLLLQGDHGKVWFRNVVVTPVKGPIEE